MSAPDHDHDDFESELDDLDAFVLEGFEEAKRAGLHDVYEPWHEEVAFMAFKLGFVAGMGFACAKMFDSLEDGDA